MSSDALDRRPKEATDATVEAVGKLSEAFEAIEEVRGKLYAAHRLTGTADLALGEAVDLRRKAGHTEPADKVDTEMQGRNVLPGRWTYQMVEEFDDGYYAEFKAIEELVRNELMGGRRHVYEAEMKAARRTEWQGRPRGLAGGPVVTRYGFHASHEQISPRQLLADVQRAEQAGFDMAMCSDHYSPWSERQGHSGYTWSAGAALATTSLRLGCVSAPGQRYHPAVHAQKIATLGQMFPGRFWVALGSGEASNEHITGDGWPRKEIRTQRLEECVDVIRRMLHGEEVSHDGLVTVDRARLWELPDPVPELVGPAVSVESGTRGRMVRRPGHRQPAGRGAARHRRGLPRRWWRGPMALQVHLSWADTDEEALRIAHEQWGGNVFGPPISWDIETARPSTCCGSTSSPRRCAAP